MNLELKKFQEDAVDALLVEVRAAQAESSRKNQAVSLTAPTGAGKTIIATALMERLLEGDGDQPPDPQTTLLWLSDQPELNEQSKRKILASSSLFSTSTTRIIDSAFDQRVLSPGVVYFLNSQKLGKDKSLVAYSDTRQNTIWDIIRSTIQERPGSFLLIVDEAHRGMQADDGEVDAQTIVQRFVKGDKELPPVPVIVGVSATPERFNKLIQTGTSRTFRPVDVDPDDVRASGLLKDEIKVLHPKEQQHSDWTLLKRAVENLLRFEQEWKAYSAAENIEVVSPLLVIQVEDGSPGVLSRTDLANVLAILEEELGHPPADAIAHCFQEGTPIEVEGRTIRYVSPSDIQSDPHVRVVLFKTSLSTGWDCPRAEVMMSFRPASDGTAIAQLVGRMVRTPLARSVPSNDFLNSVSLFLPYYDRASVDEVVDYLTSESGSASPTISVGEDETVTLVRDPSMADCFARLADLTSYTIPTVRRTNDVNRLMKLSRRLADAEIDTEAVDNSREHLLSTMRDVLKRASKDSAFNDAIKKGGKFTLVVRTHRADGKEIEEEHSITSASEDLMRFFEDVSRKLREGLAAGYVKQRVAEGVSVDDARIELIALCQKTDLIAEVSAVARLEARQLLKDFAGQISKLDDEGRATFDEIRGLSPEPEPLRITAPDAIEVADQETKYSKNLYRAEDGSFPAVLNSWESAVIADEMKRADFIGWLRNPDRKKWSLAIPYQMSGKTKPLYPDFLSFTRRADGGIGVSLLDPHLVTLEDASFKAVGLAEYAAKHGHDFERIELIRVEQGKIQRLDLKDDTVREKVAGVSTNEHLRQLFDILGGSENATSKKPRSRKKPKVPRKKR